jgi:type IV pilus assembly protein PilQ
MAALLTAVPWDGVALARNMPQPPGSRGSSSQPASEAPASTSSDGVLLKVRRLPDAVELVLEDAGQGASLIQRPQGNQWQGELRTSGQSALRVGPQALTMPAEGMQRISLDGSGDSFRLTVTPTAGASLASPVVSSDGRDLVVRFPASPLTVTQTTRPNLNQPTPVPSPAYVPPLRPRAVAPPVGDMAVGTMTTRAPGVINVSGPPVSMIFRNAPSATVLFELAKIAGYGFVAMPDSQSCNLGVGGVQTLSTAPSTPATQSTITLSFQNERYSKAVNTALRAAGWGGMLEGNTIYAGRSVLCDSFGQQITKVIRLNQADPAAAVAYLATLGALGKRPNITTTLTTTGLTESGAVSGTSTSNQQTTNEEVEIQLFRSPTGPLLGLEATFDRRLGLITLVGSPNVVAMAEQYLRQYDLRKRQVALAITILDLDLSNNSSLTSSFAYRSGDNFIVNDAGRLFGNIGETGLQPPFNVPDGDFVGYLQAQITSQSAKILANPTLIMQEGEEVGSSVGEFGAAGVGAAVRVGASVVTNFNVTTDSNGNTICNPTTTTAGLTMLAKVEKVDDNGFVTFLVAPNISAPVGSQTVPGCGIINILNARSLATSRVRVRDGQTLILTGVISDEDRAVVTKWPILGDIPIIGSLFRSTGRERTKRELVILVTPRIVNDEQGGTYGYGYRPASNDARQLIYGNGVR